MRVIVNAILYVTKTGCQWHLLPNDFPPYKTVFDHFTRMRARGVWEEIALALNEASRKKTGAKPRPHTS
jgi:putative transposase